MIWNFWLNYILLKILLREKKSWNNDGIRSDIVKLNLKV